MLSYVIPVEDKSSSVVSKSNLQLGLDIDQGINLPPRTSIYKKNGLTKSKKMAPTAIHNFINIEQANGGLANGKGAKVKTSGIIANGCTKPKPAISTESSASSLSSKASDGPNVGDNKLKPKLIQNGGAKTTSLKRVSFGSSKGSMVETLIYETPVQEETEVIITPALHASHSFPAEGEFGSDSKKVRVSFFESERPHVVTSPEPADIIFDVVDAPNMMTSTGLNSSDVPQYQRQTSTDSGWDNPFRPDGDLSREADEIVGLIKQGKPITPTSVNGTIKGIGDDRDSSDAVVVAQTKGQLAASPKKGFNGTAAPGQGPVTTKSENAAGVVEVQRTVVSASSGGDVEPVVIKKKPKCKCCVIQ